MRIIGVLFLLFYCRPSICVKTHEGIIILIVQKISVPCLQIYVMWETNDWVISINIQNQVNMILGDKSTKPNCQITSQLLETMWIIVIILKAWPHNSTSYSKNLVHQHEISNFMCKVLFCQFHIILHTPNWIWDHFSVGEIQY